MHFTLIGYAFSFICLFTNFYIKTYIKKGRRRRGEAKAATSSSSQGEGLANGSPVHTNGVVEGKKDQWLMLYALVVEASVR